MRDGESERHRAVFLPPITLVRSGDRERDVVENTHQFNLALEALVRQYPEQWIWMYRRWKEFLKGRVTTAQHPIAAAPPARAALPWRTDTASPR